MSEAIRIDRYHSVSVYVLRGFVRILAEHTPGQPDTLLSPVEARQAADMLLRAADKAESERKSSEGPGHE